MSCCSWTALLYVNWYLCSSVSVFYNYDLISVNFCWTVPCCPSNRSHW